MHPLPSNPSPSDSVSASSASASSPSASPAAAGAEPPLAAPWSLRADEVLQRLEVDPAAGLSAADVSRRRAAHGANRLDEPPEPPWWRKLAGQFADFMTGLLALAAAVSALAGEWGDALLIAAIVLANGLVSYFQERRAEASLAKLRALAEPLCTVRRDGRKTTLPAAELVVGDVIEITAGGRAPADARLLAAHDLSVDESPLTGESLPVEKRIEPVAEGAAAADRANMLHAGSTVQTGRGTAVATAVGMSTQLGRIAKLLQSTERTPTPLELQLADLSKRLAVLVAAVCVVVFAASVWRTPAARLSAALPELFMTAVSLAVAAVPEGLPAVITVALALGSQRMAARKAIIRQLAAVETLGSVGVVCSDKTGTLTRNQMEVVEHQAADDSAAGAAELWRAAALAGDADFPADAPPQGSPTDRALLRAALDWGLDVARERQAAPRVGEYVFSSHRKRVGSLHRKTEGGVRLYVSGAVERVLERCDRVASAHGPQPLDSEARGRIHAELESQAARARRVIGLAWRDLDGPPPADPETAEVGMVFLGWAAILDPVRPEAREAIDRCRAAGVRAVMITGDHPLTARAIAAELGLLADPAAVADPAGAAAAAPAADGLVLTGDALDRLDDAALSAAVPSARVYARVTPAHKLRIVRALQQRGEVVAMTGDGVNDAPALKQADIGVAMGITGTDVSKEAAKMVLADDNFASIVAAVEEGRAVYDSIRKFVRYLLTSNLAEVLCLFLAIVVGWPAPLVPVHLLWINLVTDGLPALALAFEKPEGDLMSRPPRPPSEGLFTAPIVAGITTIGLAMALACLAVYWAWLPAGLDAMSATAEELALDRPRTMMFLTLSLFQLFFILGIHSRRTSFFAKPLDNPILLWAVAVGAAMQLAVVYAPLVWPGLAARLHVAPLTMFELAVSVGTASSALFLAEGWKLWLRLREPAPA